jgi:hypothetical protein
LVLWVKGKGKGKIGVFVRAVYLYFFRPFIPILHTLRPAAQFSREELWRKFRVPFRFKRQPEKSWVLRGVSAFRVPFAEDSEALGVGIGDESQAPYLRA